MKPEIEIVRIPVERLRARELAHIIESARSGEPVILLHGGQGDYRSGEPQMRELSRYYHVISYSRRYNYPNANPQTATDHSARVEAADLEALIKALRLKRVNLVGTSMGAAAALTLAIG